MAKPTNPPKASNAKPIRTIRDLSHDDKNANKGTERGGSVIAKSLKQFGTGRSVLADKHGQLIAGNKTVEHARAPGFDDVIVVHTDGRKAQQQTSAWAGKRRLCWVVE